MPDAKSHSTVLPCPVCGFGGACKCDPENGCRETGIDAVEAAILYRQEPDEENTVSDRPETTGRLTNGVFSALAARIAAVAAQWSADTTMPLQDYNREIDRETAERFCNDIRVRLDRIMEMARG